MKASQSKKIKTRSSKRGQHSETQNSEDECIICYGIFSDDLDMNGNTTRQWIQCTRCKNWMHEDCPSKDDNDSSYHCVCGTIFK